MKRLWALISVVILGSALLGSGGSASGQPKPPPASQAQDPGQRLDQMIHRLAQAKAARTSGATLNNFRLVGHAPLDGFGDYGNLYAHGDFAYVGSRCGAQHQGGDGVQVVDISHPSRPRTVSTLPNPAYTRAEDVKVQEVHTPSFTGVLAVVGIQACFGSGHESEVVPGLRFFDVTHPAHPVLVGHWDLPQATIGCHEIDAVQRADGRLLAVCARNLIDHINSKGVTAVHIVDISNPASPQTITNWSLNVDPAAGVGCLPNQFAHSARFEDGGNSLYVSYWDAGTVHLDITAPASPAVVSDTKITPPDANGDNHSMTLADGGRLLIINTENFSPSDCPGVSANGSWGSVYIYDNRDPKNPAFLGTFSTDNSRSTRTDGSYTDHNTEVIGNDQFFSSWYSDGIVWWTMADHGVTHQLGQFTPPPNKDGTPPMVWGVFIDTTHHLILASDISSGLWIVKPKGLSGF
jgi:hypothetical protein